MAAGEVDPDRRSLLLSLKLARNDEEVADAREKLADLASSPGRSAAPLPPRLLAAHGGAGRRTGNSGSTGSANLPEPEYGRLLDS
jgi:hypothetical protein